MTHSWQVHSCHNNSLRHPVVSAPGNVKMICYGPCCFLVGQAPQKSENLLLRWNNWSSTSRKVAQSNKPPLDNLSGENFKCLFCHLEVLFQFVHQISGNGQLPIICYRSLSSAHETACGTKHDDIFILFHNISIAKIVICRL